MRRDRRRRAAGYCAGRRRRHANCADDRENLRQTLTRVTCIGLSCHPTHNSTAQTSLMNYGSRILWTLLAHEQAAAAVAVVIMEALRQFHRRISVYDPRGFLITANRITRSIKRNARRIIEMGFSATCFRLLYRWTSK